MKDRKTITIQIGWSGEPEGEGRKLANAISLANTAHKIFRKPFNC
jgi:hypothetical protein